MWENFVSTRLRCASFFSPALLGLPSHQQRCLSVRVPGEKNAYSSSTRLPLHAFSLRLACADPQRSRMSITPNPPLAANCTQPHRDLLSKWSSLITGRKSIFFASDLQMRVWSSGGYNTKPAALRMQCQSYQVNSFVTMKCGGNRFLIGNELLGKAALHRINACSRSRA